jgi:hypothetical protein
MAEAIHDALPDEDVIGRDEVVHERRIGSRGARRGGVRRSGAGQCDEDGQEPEIPSVAHGSLQGFGVPIKPEIRAAAKRVGSRRRRTGAFRNGRMRSLAPTRLQPAPTSA